MAFIFHDMEELMAAGIKHAKINKSVIICTLSSVFKIRAGWGFPNLEICASCWWSRTVNNLTERNFKILPKAFFPIASI